MAEKQTPPTFAESIEWLLSERQQSCSYYLNGEYSAHVDKAMELDRKIRKRLGKKLFKAVWNDLSKLDAVRGEIMAGISESCYRRGFNDALILAREMDQAGKGHSSVFK